MERFDIDNIHLIHGDALDFYAGWPSPVAIISDGAYGIGGFEGDPRSPAGLMEWYEPHARVWSESARTYTTLWFWNTEVGWANVHPLLDSLGWKYVRCCIWDKGIGHIAGKCNTGTLRQFPCVTEVCVQYVRKNIYGGIKVQNWLHSEWIRTGLPLFKANEACGVKNAATRKYLALDQAFYFPPREMFEKMRAYANEYGDPAGRPYFCLGDDQGQSERLEEAKRDARPRFHCPVGYTNVWKCNTVAGKDRMAHPNQKPLELMDLIISSTTDEGDVVWEPFGGVFSGAVSARRLNRSAYASEVSRIYFDAGVERFRDTGQSYLF